MLANSKYFMNNVFMPEQSIESLSRQKGELSYWDRKGGIITAMLDEISPITDEMPADLAEKIDIERQSLVMRTGWNQMEPEELEAMWLEGHETLPYATEE